MVAVSNRPITSMAHDLREESIRREKVIRQTLQSVLSENQVQIAIFLCKQEFPPNEPFSTSVFCQRLVERIPGLNLTHETRLMLLRTLRQTVSEGKVNRHTYAIEIPTELLGTSIEKPANAKSQLHQGVTGEIDNGSVRQEPTSNREPKRQELLTGHPETGQRSRERRQHPRKPVQLPGHYWAELDDTPTGEIMFIDLSLSGACFRMLSPHRLKKKESLPLEFKLNDATTILQNVLVRWTQDDLVGVSWLDKKMVNGPLKAYLGI